MVMDMATVMERIRINKKIMGDEIVGKQSCFTKSR